MKTLNLFPAVIALLVLLSSPFHFSLPCDSRQPNGGLICYCCDGPGACKCAMISCPKGGIKGEVRDYTWSPDLLLSSFDLLNLFPRDVNGLEPFSSPRTVYLKVPVKPPNSL
jgi:hypothetical protein